MPHKQKVTGIGGIFFRAKNPASLAAWYRTHLGLPIDSQWNGCIFNWRDAKNPKKLASTVWSPFKHDTSYFGSPRQASMINYRVANLARFLAQLKRAGVWVDPTIQSSEYGRFAWIRDLEGNRVELWQPPPAPRARRKKAQPPAQKSRRPSKRTG